METPLHSYSFTRISWLILCPFWKNKLPFTYFFPPQEVDQQNNNMVTGVVPLDSEGESTGRGCVMTAFIIHVSQLESTY